MKYSKASRNKQAAQAGPAMWVILALLIFCGWLVSSAIILYQSNKIESKKPDAVKITARQVVTDNKPYSTLVQERGKQFRQFLFPGNLSFGSVAAVKYKSYGSRRGHEVLSALEVERDNIHAAQGMVRYPADETISFLPNQIIAVDPTHLNRFRPDEIFDISMKQTHDVDVDVYLEACTQMKGVSRLDLSESDSLTAEGLPLIDEYTSLKQLELWVSARTVALIAPLPALQKVSSLGLYSKVDLTPVLATLKTSKNLKALKVQTPALSSLALYNISQTTNVEELSLASLIFRDPKQADTALNKLSSMKHLKILSLQLLPGMAGDLTALRDKVEKKFPQLSVLQLGDKTYFLD